MKAIHLRLLILCFPVPIFAGTPSTEDFSVAEDKSIGEPIELHPGWYAVPEGGALITSDDWMTGGQSLVLLPGDPVAEVVRELPPGMNPRYVEVWLRPVFDTSPHSPAIDAEGARLFFVREGGLGTVVAGAASETACIADLVFGMLEGGLSDRWIRVTLELDHGAEQWSLAVNGEVVLEGAPASHESFPGEIVFFGDTEVPVYIDGLKISADPFVEFVENDGSAEQQEVSTTEGEIAASVLSVENDDDGISAVQSADIGAGEVVAEYLDTVYVNNAAGDDANDGRAAAAEGSGRGPVASLAAALTRVSDGGTIVIYEGVASYTGDMPALGGKNVNLKTVGNVRVRAGG